MTNKTASVNQMLSLTFVEQLKRESSFTVFIDFSKAYDSIDRRLLLQKLHNFGLYEYMLNAIKSLYDAVKCCVRINGEKIGVWVLIMA